MADVFGIPTQWADGQETRWETELDSYNPSDHELLWFFKPVTSANFTDFAVGIKDSGKWETSVFLDTQDSSWVYELKVRNKEGHGITDITSGSFEVLIIISELEEQLRAVRNALVLIGQGKVPQSYSIRGRSLSRYSLGELTSLYNILKRESAAEQNKRGHNHGYLHGNFGGLG